MAKSTEADRSETGVKAVENSYLIVKTLMQWDGAGGITEIADAVEMSKSSVYKHLATLRNHGFVAKKGDEYRLGLRFLDVGSFVREQYTASAFIKQKIRDVALETDEICFFSVLEDGRLTILFREVGHEGPPTRSRIGMQMYLHQVSAGKAILSKYSDDQIRAIVDKHGLPPATSKTITDFDELIADINQIRSRGYALSDEEATEGLLSVGVPVSLPGGEVLGGCAVAGPVNRMAGEKSNQEIPKLLRSVANEIELSIAHSG